jgi:hypothetical protein
MVNYRLSVLKVNKKNPLLRQNPFYRGQSFSLEQHMPGGIPRHVGYFDSKVEAKNYARLVAKKQKIGIKFV